MKGRRLAVLTALLATALAGPAIAKKPKDINGQSWGFANSIKAGKILDHLKAFQAIANANGGTRALGSPGYDASLNYVGQRLTRAGYQVTLQPFIANLFVELDPPVFERVSPPKTYAEGTDFFTMEFSGSGDVTEEVVLIDFKDPTTPGGSTSGCEDTDFLPPARRLAARSRLYSAGRVPSEKKLRTPSRLVQSASSSSMKDSPAGPTL